jgi:hypothetical protein
MSSHSCIKTRRAYERAWRAANKAWKKEYDRARWLRNAYGLTLAEYEALLSAQGGKCAVCNSTDTGRKNSPWSIDHCHATGRVRGLLCHQCNIALGHARDNPALLRAMARYVEKFAVVSDVV